MVKVTIDGRELEFPEGTSLFDACREARGEALPHFCYHPDLSVAGVCRLCQVEVEGMPKLTIACNTGVREGMVVHTRNERVKTAARQILEMHLINHPVDCPICDQAGECGLQDQYMNHGLYESEVDKDDKVHKAKAEVIGPHVILDKERCVLCSRCVRFCDEVTGTGQMGIFNRGDRAEIGIAPGKELANNYSLNTVDICPVGALTSRDFRFKKRVWLLKSTASICPGCATGCNVRVDHEAGRIFRLKPRYNKEVNGRWMCDIGRMTYRGVHSEKRLDGPMLRGDGDLAPVSWSDLHTFLAERQVGLWISSPAQTLEEQALLAALGEQARTSGGVSTAGRGDGDDLLLHGDRTPNRTGLEWTDLQQHDPASLVALVRETSGAVVVHGGDPAETAPGFLAAVGGRALIFLGTHANATSKAATVVVPMSVWAEKDGLFVNKDGRVQAVRRAVARPEQAVEDWRFLVDLWSAAGCSDAPAGLPALRRWLAERVPALNDLDLNALPAGGLAPATAPAGAGGDG